MKSIKITNTMFRMRRIILTLGVVCCIQATFGQQVPRFSQYTMNEFLFNPAIAGADGLTTINLTAGKEWFGFSRNTKTPETFAVSAQTRLLKKQFKIISQRGGGKTQKSTKGRVGIGGSVFSDMNGAVRRSGLQLSYAYHLFLNSTQLSFGISGSMCQLKFDKDYLDFYDNDNETMLSIASHPTWIPDFNAGINLMTKNFLAGASVAQIFQSPFMFGNPDVNYKSTELGYKRLYYLIADYKYELPHSYWELEPSCLLKMYDIFNFKNGTYGPSGQLDVSLKVLYNKSYWFGASYRTPSDIIVFGGLKFSNYYAGYAFEYGFNDLSRNSYGSHEISLSARFGDTNRRYRWIERY